MITLAWHLTAACGLILVLGGCAQSSLRIPKSTTAQEFPSEELRSSFGNIAVVPMYAPPRIELNETVYDKGECAKEMAGSAVAGMMDGCTDAMGCLGMLLLSPVVAGIGAVAGAVEADTEEQVRARIELIHAKTASSGIAGDFQEKGLEIAAQYDEFSIQTEPAHQDTTFEYIPFDLLAEREIDTVIQLGITDIASFIAESVYCDPALGLNINTALTVFSSDGTPVYSTSVYRSSKPRELEDWAKRDAKHWDEALHEFIDDVTARLLEDVFLQIDSPAEILQVPTPSYAGSSHVMLIEKQPTLAWAWDSAESNSRHEGLLSPEAQVSYDLRVVESGLDRVYYERLNLSEPQHKLEKKLRKKRLYSWQIRATFMRDGKRRRTPWLGDFAITYQN
jgi:hypothetical protein